MSEETSTSRVCARVGLLGNPSDSMEGAAIAMAIENYSAVVSLEACDNVVVEPHPQHDPFEFTDLQSLAAHVRSSGYYGGQRIILATCRKFAAECERRQLTLPQKGFRLKYDTNIPKRSGLSGSSAIICATFNCLLRWFKLEDAWPVVDRPTFVLSVEEEELGITAGLMDRVAQVYGGMVYMNLRKQCMHNGHGQYEYLPSDGLPTLWLMHANNPSDSGRVHAPVKQRWREGDKKVTEGVAELAQLADRGKLAFSDAEKAIPPEELGRLMDANFDIRRRLYGDAALGAVNLAMIECARSIGASAKFCGSGGAVLVLCASEDQEVGLLEKCEERHYVLEKIRMAPRNFEAAAMSAK